MSRTKTTVPSIEDYYSKLNLGAFLRNDSVRRTIDRANESLGLDVRVVMIITGIHETFMEKKKIGPNQRGDKYKMQVAAGSTHVGIEMEFIRTHDSSLIRTVDEIESAYGTSRSALFSISDEILKTLRLNRIPVDSMEYAKRSV
ncbi:MAG: hypothetical protein KGH66_04105, partial [Candidatus Micrarchaeota archaeon]|nr:hypothetical protein [Candidatus Micrarchaeota archaeon]